MEISLLKVLLNNFSSFFHLSSLDNISHEPAQKYYQKIEEMLKLLKPVLDAISDADILSEEQLQKAAADLSHSVDELRELFESWHPLRSKIYFVLQLESLKSKIRASGLEIFELLKSSDQHLPLELNASTLEICAQKIKQMGLEQTSAIINKAIREKLDGSGPSAESLTRFSDCLGLRSNQELLIEAVALEKLKDNAEQAENNGEVEYFDQMISLVTHMHERLVMMKQSQSSNPVPIPPDFCCPLSLELMTDPVIVASGQTYERAFIRKWIDLGLTVCPKTRQGLAHTNLIPNYTVKALIANWCENNNVKLPDPIKSMSLNQPSSLADGETITPKDPRVLPHSRSHRPISPDSGRSTSLGKNLFSSSGILGEGTSPSHPRSASEGSLPVVAGNSHGFGIARLSLNGSEDRSANSEEQSMESSSRPPTSPSKEHSTASGASAADEQSSSGHKLTASSSNVLGNVNVSQGLSADGNEDSSRATAYGSDASGELTSEPQAASTLNIPQREPEFLPRLETRYRSQTMWRRPSDRFVPRMVSSHAIETRADLSGVETQARQLVEDLKSNSLEAQKRATSELRFLARNNMENRIVIANCGAISLLVNLLSSADSNIQENAVTALLNLSINDNNKSAIANAEAIEPLIHVLKTGSPEAKENSAATLFSLSVIEDNKVKIGRSGAIKPLVDLLGSGTPRGKKDAATALFNLSIFHENKARIVQAGAVKYLVELMDPAAGMVDKAVAVLANLATIHEGRTAIGQERGIPVLVEVVELGSARGKENAAAALLQLCTNSNRFCSMVLQEGAVPPLVALSQSGTPRAKEKAQALLSHFRNQRHGNAGRG
ncbi:U-box domain-containing protein 4-like [Diospyros lotus]|uniref:U-box domain-containing protein 4-like n=1 Tax=Diospyros lotus TaxID=55363 RepID=UPI0022547447|nr:U-box domain-containing protein 4-like [Diospyros lotus]XP_052196261.1 U-box domain-containing protein 4-like [Diospyros lotus]XP_052196262.1 U-box domain-containing protein 4-like [Diospyros lotus]XP_052196263.1 U-box domain-containing protein 4-like [Diospyros lotus]XP_052196264.1 U-box domain-containing protein 4-like [Diospyros lotus]XP_052196265.1 U-box domain-containing protein 4-like [Diospyros lotus]